ncbi:MAG: redoxin domain-containing protein [Actinobacteria bacterium]|nr:redoxin domain-containing protein [Actinomycetota bacterium]
MVRATSWCPDGPGSAAVGGQLSARQHRFLQDAAHQLRTSITIALGHAELVAAGLSGHDEQPDMLVVVDELTRLKSLSERLLLIAASQDPEFLCPAPVALDSFLLEALRRWQPTARRVWAAGDLDPVLAVADQERLAQAVDALLENAVQHTGPGDTIRVSVRRDRQTGDACLMVEDSGDGIGPDDLGHVFERFWTGTAGRRPRGTGLGLTLVQAVAAGHGGQVRAHSTPGAGSRFELTLPATVTARGLLAAPGPDPAGPARPEPGPGRAPRARWRGRRIGGPHRPGPPGWARPRPVTLAVAAAAAGCGAVIAVVSAGTHAPAATPAAPAFTLPSLRDPAQTVSLGAYRGQPVIVNFFASWCPPCQEETPLLVSFARTAAGETVIIGIDADDSATAARQFLARQRVPYPVGFEAQPAVADAYGVSATGIPETFFLNARHDIVKRVIGDVTHRELVQDAALMKG